MNYAKDRYLMSFFGLCHFSPLSDMSETHALRVCITAIFDRIRDSAKRLPFGTIGTQTGESS